MWNGSGNLGLDRSTISTLYRSLSASEFISTYSATSPWEDFADSLAYVVISEKLNARYVVNIWGPTHFADWTYDAAAKVRSRAFSKKYRYIQNFLNRKDIVYPC